MEGRQITNAVLITNEVVDELLQQNKDGVLCKLDKEKTDDHVNWGFIGYMLARLGCGGKWRKID